MEDNIVHQRENNEDTESFLQENIQQFETDIMFLLKLMKRGERLSAKTVVQKYGKEPRRLRDLFIAGRCQRQWVLDDRGKRKYVEYFVSIPGIPTKSEVIQKADAIIKVMKDIPKRMEVVFTLPDDPPTAPRYTEQKLFSDD